MKKLLLTLTSILLMNHNMLTAQTEAPRILPVSSTNTAPQGTATETNEQKIQMHAGMIHECAAEKILSQGWTDISISLDKVDNKLELFSVAVMANKQIQPIEVCDQNYIIQSMHELFKLTSQGKNINWQSLSFRSKPDRKFSFRSLTAEDITKLTNAAKK